MLGKRLNAQIKGGETAGAGKGKQCGQQDIGSTLLGDKEVDQKHTRGRQKCSQPNRRRRIGVVSQRHQKGNYNDLKARHRRSHGDVADTNRSQYQALPGNIKDRNQGGLP